MRGAVAALVAIAITFAISAPATATTSGKQTFEGVIVVSGSSGTRKVVSSLVVAKGVFRGAGRVVEIEDVPGEPDNVLRDDLVFAAGTVHIRSVAGDPSLSLNPRSCIYSARVQSTGAVVGGTRLFAAATGNYAATVKAWGLARRDSAGKCTLDQQPLYEVDTFVINGSLSL
ncbi:MAG: hypothetical protein QOJ29_2814 [Thermoleophilaceae bacterium]|nr:hypothetical protein [Thermoleophilaceae bacterium]